MKFKVNVDVMLRDLALIVAVVGTILLAGLLLTWSN